MTTITIERELLERAKDALIESVDLVRHDYENDWRHGVPTRKAQLEGSRLALEAHEKVIHDSCAALAAPATAPSWQDAPTVPGLWAHDGRIFTVFHPEVWGLDGRCYGPIPEDKQ